MGESGITMVIENPQTPPPPVAAVLTEAKAHREMKIRENKKEWTMKKRDALMVAATLIAGMAFQAAVNPPGGVWGEEKDAGNGKKMLAGGFTGCCGTGSETRERLFLGFLRRSRFLTKRSMTKDRRLQRATRHGWARVGRGLAIVFRDV